MKTQHLHIAILYFHKWKYFVYVYGVAYLIFTIILFNFNFKMTFADDNMLPQIPIEIRHITNLSRGTKWCNLNLKKQNIH